MTLTEVQREPVTPSVASWPTTVLFTLTSFVGAGLLFVVQPMVTKLVLPSYGGSATVWSTASLFFQLVLLGSYAWTHTTSRLGGRQPFLQVLVMLLPLLVLPIALPADAAPAADANQALWLLRTLVVMIGLPFAVLACTGPLTQKWYSWTSGHGRDDPYFLYAASNLGSFVGLLSYPFLIEPHLSLANQRAAFSWGYAVFLVLTGACAAVALRGRVDAADEPDLDVSGIAPRRMLWWAFLAFVPASLSLAITAHLTTDVAPIPLLWVLPLGIYLATFIAAFGRRSRLVPVWAVRLAAALAVLTAGAMTSFNQGVSFLLNLSLLAVAGFVAHARLAADRPDPRHLTLFYLVIASGGAAGGLVNGLLAPSLLDRVWEYPLMLLMVPLVSFGSLAAVSNALTRRYHPGFVVVAAAALAVAAALAAGAVAKISRPSAVGLLAMLALLVLLAAALAWLTVRGLSVGLALLVVITWFSIHAEEHSVHHLRSFFAAYRVLEVDGQHLLTHGSTTHGLQFLDPTMADLPTTYYASPGSCQDVFELMADRLQSVGVVGLGTGTVATYGHPGEQLTFFEVDQEMVDLASDPRYFSFVSDSAADIHMVVGDGRLEVAKQPDGAFDLLVLDAFSSDSIPMHLLTREAMAMYATKLAPDGVLLVHISNRLFDLEPVLAAAATDLGWDATLGRGDGSTPGSTGSIWVALTEDNGVTSDLRSRTQWRPVDLSRRVTWTDDYSSIFSVIK